MTGIDESAGRSSGEGFAPPASRCAPSAATIAPLSVHRPRARHAQRDPRGVAALLGQRAQPGVGRHAAAEQQRVHPALPRRPHGLGREHVHHGLLEARRDVRAPAPGCPARCSASTCRATAVFSPEKEKSNGASRGPVSPRGNAIAAGSPSRATRSMCGPPGNGSPSSRATLSNASPAASSIVAPSGVTGPARSGHVEQAGVPAGDQQRQARRQRAVLQGVDGDVRGEVVDPVQRHVPGRRVGLRRGHPDQQRPGQPGPGGDRDGVDVARRGSRPWPARGAPPAPSPAGGPATPPPAPRRRSGRAPRPRRRSRWPAASSPAAVLDAHDPDAGLVAGGLDPQDDRPGVSGSRRIVCASAPLGR